MEVIMMLKKKQKYEGKFKAKIALEALREYKTLSEISSEYRVHSTQITRWRNQALEGLPDIFSNGAKNAGKSEEQLQSLLYQQIGQLKVELDWVKKKSGFIN